MSDIYGITQFLDFKDNKKESIQKKRSNSYNDIKYYGDKKYTGMTIGGIHYWNYENSKWYEVKQTPNIWKITFNSIKRRYRDAPHNSGASVNTKYHWYIMADQIAEKIDANSYMTTMKGIKFKIGHKRPYWRKFSYEYSEQQSYKDKIIEILEYTLAQLKNE